MVGESRVRAKATNQTRPPTDARLVRVLEPTAGKIIFEGQDHHPTLQAVDLFC